MPAVESLAIVVDQEECIGCSACVDEAPETFELDDETKACVKTPPGDELEFILSAAAACPTEAITVTDIEENQILYHEA